MIPNSISQQFIWTALALATTILLVACGKPDDAAQPATNTQQASPQPAQQATFNAADCDRLADPKPTDESAAARATAVSQGVAARQACQKATQNASAPNQANADLARIREIKEKEQADLEARKLSDKEYGRRIKDAAHAPMRELKY